MQKSERGHTCSTSFCSWVMRSICDSSWNIAASRGVVCRVCAPVLKAFRVCELGVVGVVWRGRLDTESHVLRLNGRWPRRMGQALLTHILFPCNLITVLRHQSFHFKECIYKRTCPMSLLSTPVPLVCLLVPFLTSIPATSIRASAGAPSQHPHICRPSSASSVADMPLPCCQYP